MNLLTVYNAIKNYGILNLLKIIFIKILTYYYLRIRQILRIRSRIEKIKMIRNQFAPVVIFAYNRPDKLNNLLESLSKVTKSLIVLIIFLH